MKQILMVVWKSILELWREPLLTLLILLFPAVMVGLYNLGFGQTSQGLSSLMRVMVKNNDRGALGASLVVEIEHAVYEGKPVFEVSRSPDEATAVTNLREGKSVLMLVIPPDFSAAIERSKTGSHPLPVVIFEGDLTSDNYTFAYSFLEDLVYRFGERAGGRTSPAEVTYEFVPGTGTMNDLQYGVPGVIVFGVLFLIISTAIMLVRETSHHTLRRLRLTGIGALPILAGITLAQIVAALVQIAIAWGTALVFGFQSSGSLALGIFICVLLSFAAIGLGLVTACFARNDGEAVNLATGVLVPVVFLSGAVFPMPKAPIATIAGQVVQAYDIFPAAHAAEAMRRVLVFGDGPSAIVYPLVALGVLAAVIFAGGVWLFQRMRLERSS